MLPPSASGEVNFTVAENPSSSKSVITASWFVRSSCNFVHAEDKIKWFGMESGFAISGAHLPNEHANVVSGSCLL